MAQWARELGGWIAAADSVEAMFASLATVRADGGSANRTVVVRGFLEGAGVHDGVALAAGEGLCVVAHRGSDKVAEARLGRWAELCWYWPAVREQYRIAGPLVVLDEAQPGTGALATVRPDLWGSLSAATREMFAWPSPGESLEHDTAQTTAVDVDAATPPATFAVLVLAPRRVDWLRLCEPGPHQRAVETRREHDGTWQRTEITP